MKNIPTLQAAALMMSIMLIAPLFTQAEPMTRTAPKDQSALAKAPRMHTLAGLGTFAEVRSFQRPGRNRDARSTSPGSPQLSFDGLPQIVRALPAQVVPALPNQFVPALSGQLSAPLPGQIIRSLPGQLVRSLPGQIAPPLPGQIVR